MMLTCNEDQKEDRKAMKDVFFCRYVWEPGAQLTECGPAAERCRRAQALCRKGRGVKRIRARPGTATW